MNIKIVKEFKKDCADIDMVDALKIANKFQKRFFIPKFFFIFMGIFFSIVLLQDMIMGRTLLDSKVNFIVYACIFLTGMLISILIIIYGGICPYCHNFQKQNGKVKGINDSSIFYVRGASPFIHYCTDCGAPLSKKAVKEFYQNKEPENPIIDW